MGPRDCFEKQHIKIVSIVVVLLDVSDFDRLFFKTIYLFYCQPDSARLVHEQISEILVRLVIRLRSFHNDVTLLGGSENVFLCVKKYDKTLRV